jgi:hypothetical protein
MKLETYTSDRPRVESGSLCESTCRRSICLETCGMNMEDSKK